MLDARYSVETVLRSDCETIDISYSNIRVLIAKKVKNLIAIGSIIDLNQSVVSPELLILDYSKISLILDVEYLSVVGCNIDTLPDLRKVKYLDITGNNITHLPTLPKLQQLYCSMNKITHLNHPTVQVVDAGYNSIRSLNCPKAKIVSIPYNKIVYFKDVSLSRCLSLNISHNLILNLICCPNVQILDISYNKLTTARWLDVNCRILNLNGNDICINSKEINYLAHVKSCVYNSDILTLPFLTKLIKYVSTKLHSPSIPELSNLASPYLLCKLLYYTVQ